MTTSMNARAGVPVPYYSQYETSGLASAVVEEGAPVALARDARWRSSGATTLSEYVTWADHLCGMACVKMIVAARSGRILPTLELARAATACGAYVVDRRTGAIKGLIYAPVVPWLARAFDIRAGVRVGMSADDLPALFSRGGAEFFIASVHPQVSRPDSPPPGKGGHLVLVMAADKAGVTFHDPSGTCDRSRENVRLSLPVFDRFFAGRGIAVFP